MASPLDSHWAVVKRILRYLKGFVSRNYCMVYLSAKKIKWVLQDYYTRNFQEVWSFWFHKHEYWLLSMTLSKHKKGLYLVLLLSFVWLLLGNFVLLGNDMALRYLILSSVIIKRWSSEFLFKESYSFPFSIFLFHDGIMKEHDLRTLCAFNKTQERHYESIC